MVMKRLQTEEKLEALREEMAIAEAERKKLIRERRKESNTRKFGSGGTAIDLSDRVEELENNEFYTGKELLHHLLIDRSTLQNAERQGWIVPVNIYNNVWKDLRGRSGMVYAVKLDKDQMEDLKSPYTKKMYLGKNVKYWSNKRFGDKSQKKHKRKTRKVLKKMTDAQYKKNFERWEREFDKQLEKQIRGFELSQKVENGVKDFSYATAGSIKFKN